MAIEPARVGTYQLDYLTDGCSQGSYLTNALQGQQDFCQRVEGLLCIQPTFQSSVNFMRVPLPDACCKPHGEEIDSF